MEKFTPEMNKASVKAALKGQLEAVIDNIFEGGDEALDAYGEVVVMADEHYGFLQETSKGTPDEIAKRAEAYFRRHLRTLIRDAVTETIDQVIRGN